MERVTASTAPTRSSGRAGKPDQVCADAVEIARRGLDAVDPDHIGEHLGVVAEGERLVTHFFACRLPGYRGWRWAVTRHPRSRAASR